MQPSFDPLNRGLNKAVCLTIREIPVVLGLSLKIHSVMRPNHGRLRARKIKLDNFRTRCKNLLDYIVWQFRQFSLPPKIKTEREDKHDNFTFEKINRP